MAAITRLAVNEDFGDAAGKLDGISGAVYFPMAAITVEDDDHGNPKKTRRVVDGARESRAGPRHRIPVR